MASKTLSFNIVDGEISIALEQATVANFVSSKLGNLDSASIMFDNIAVKLIEFNKLDIEKGLLSGAVGTTFERAMEKSDTTFECSANSTTIVSCIKSSKNGNYIFTVKTIETIIK